MKWVCLVLAVSAVVVTGLVAFDSAYPEDKSEAIRVCITAAVVNGVFFSLLHFRKPTKGSTKAK